MTNIRPCPCPCCGGPAKYRTQSDIYFRVSCKNCGLHISGTSMENAISRWNRRASDAVIAQQQQKIRELNIIIDKLTGRERR